VRLTVLQKKLHLLLTYYFRKSYPLRSEVIRKKQTCGLTDIIIGDFLKVKGTWSAYVGLFTKPLQPHVTSELLIDILLII